MSITPKDQEIANILAETINLSPNAIEYDNDRIVGLNLSELSLSQLPPELWRLNHLQKLDLSKNQLPQLPPEVGQLVNLQTLNLNDNQLNQVPSEIGQLTNLRVLYLWENQLSSLQTLRLDRNQLREVPGGLWLLIGLQVLSLEEQGSLVVQEVKHIILHADRHMVWILELPRYVDTFWSIVERATRKCVHINDA